MKWISATDLEAWAKALNARDALPEIVSDLIRASTPDLASIRFPSGDKGQVRGFDGHLVSNVQSLNVPLGRSLWEFGTNVDYQGKATGDFEKRTKDVTASEQKDITYVFVSPRTWDSSNKSNKIEDFVAERKKQSSWRDVLYIDGAALETWLRHHPAVSAWHARNTLKLHPIDGLRSSDEFWSDFAGRFGPPITEDVLLCEREEDAKRLIQELIKPANTTMLVADSPDQAVAFAIAAIRKAEPEIRLFFEARTLVVDSSAAGRQLLPQGRLVLLLRNDASRSPTQFQPMGTTFVPLGRQQRGLNAPTLARPTAHAMGMAMCSMGLESNRAITLARGSGRSLAALSRLIPGGHYDPPSWVQKAQDLLPGILAGAWDASNAKDREVIERLANGLSYSQIETRIRAHRPDEDPPFDLEGSVWKVLAPMDAFVRVGPLIGPEDAKHLRAAMLKVFGELEPEPDPDEVVSFMRQKPSVYSDWLRDGLATTLLLLAVWGEVAGVNLEGKTGQEFANDTLQELPGLNSDPRLLTSLRDVLPLLAEAAPSPLLSALERMLEGDGCAIMPIFEERQGFLHPTSKHTGVLWALETLAWDPEYFRKAALTLARLDKVDPGGKLANRPSKSLAEIFLPWNPNTNASWAQRLAVFDEICRVAPETAWELILQLIPNARGFSTPTAKPKLREAGAAERDPVTYRDLWSSQAVLCQRAIALAATDAERWSRLIGSLANFPQTEREMGLSALDDTLSHLNDSERQKLWVKIRDEVARHRRFKAADWSLAEHELAPFQLLAEKYAPADPMLALVALFDGRLFDEPGDLGKANERTSAVQSLYREKGSAAVVRLASEARVSYLVIQAIDSAGFSNSELADLLTVSFQKDPAWNFTINLSGLYRRLAGEHPALSWLRQQFGQGKATAQSIAELLQAWPDGRETWRVVRDFGSEVKDAFWTQKSAHYLKGNRCELLRFNLMLLRYGRAVAALQSSQDRLKELPTKLLFRMLDGVIPELNIKAAPVDSMTSYYVTTALEVLDKRDDVAEVDIATREYQLFPLIEHDGRNMRIYEVMAREPHLFHQILGNVFRAEENEDEGEASALEKANAQLSYRLLSNFKALPGKRADGIDDVALREWIDELRRLGTASGIPKVTDSYVGRVLANAPPDSDGNWPHESVRREIERLASDEIESAIRMARYNLRGVHSRGVYEGGVQERDLAKKYFDAADTAAHWPRTASLLRTIGKIWEEEGKEADLEARKRKLRS